MAAFNRTGTWLQALMLRSLLFPACMVPVVACAPAAQVSENSQAALFGVEWQLQRLGTEPVAGADHQAPPFIVFLPQNRIAGSGGCNRLMGSYTLQGQQLTLAGLGGTRMACAGGMDTEQRFMQLLGSVATWQIRDGRLELADASGVVIAVFTASR
jgi:heat shock protein HslJ